MMSTVKTWRSDGHPQHERALIFLTEYTFSALGKFNAVCTVTSFLLSAGASKDIIWNRRHRTVTGYENERQLRSLLSTPFV